MGQTRLTNLKIIPNAFASDDNDTLFVSSSNSNLISMIKIEKEKICSTEKIGDDLFVFRKQLYGLVIDGEDDVFFISYNSDFILVLNKKNKMLNKYRIIDDLLEKNSKFIFAKIIENKLWLFGCGVQAVLVFDLDKRRMTEEKWVYEGLSEIFGTSKWEIYDGICYDNHIMLVTISKPIIIDIDIKSHTIKRIEIDIEDNGYQSIVLYNNSLFLSPNGKNHFIKYDLLKHSFKKLEYSGEADDWSYHSMVQRGKYAYFFPYNGKKVVCINMETDNLQEVNCFSHCLKNDRLNAISAASLNNVIIVAIENSNDFLFFNPQKGEFTVQQAFIKETLVSLDFSEIINEGEEADLSNYIESII